MLDIYSAVDKVADIGVPGRPRLYEVIEIVKAANQRRLRSIPFPTFQGQTYYTDELQKDPALEFPM